MAYLDPGTGSFMLQILLSALFGALVAVKLFWKRIRGFFSRLFGSKDGGKKDNAS